MTDTTVLCMYWPAVILETGESPCQLKTPVFCSHVIKLQAISLLTAGSMTTIQHPDQTPLQSSVTVHRRPPGPITSHHRGPGPPPVPNANTTGSATSTTISPHDSESAILDPTLRPPVRDPQTAIHGAATEALDQRVIKQRDSGEGG
ncbi:unnamed protein product [Pleuronectes platessa]|uniref:Uncharacterized protein n=1 Tax=Pleuronectes platessa TaxID=8262 RepID=A0A9N7TUN7_PLEPL|nr:unnamed protein product [Pleuronectes platessa]